MHKLCRVAAPPNDWGVFFWPDLKPVARGRAEGLMGVEAGGRVGSLQSHTAEVKPAEALAAAAVSHMAYSKMGDSEKGRKDEKIGREEGMGDVYSVRSG